MCTTCSTTATCTSGSTRHNRRPPRRVRSRVPHVTIASPPLLRSNTSRTSADGAEDERALPHLDSIAFRELRERGGVDGMAAKRTNVALEPGDAFILRQPEVHRTASPRDPARPVAPRARLQGAREGAAGQRTQALWPRVAGPRAAASTLPGSDACCSRAVRGPMSTAARSYQHIAPRARRAARGWGGCSRRRGRCPPSRC